MNMEKKMVDLLLVDPPVTQQSRFGRLAKAGSVLPSLGLCLLAAVARQQGFSVAIIDGNLFEGSEKELAEVICQKQPRWVGFSATTLTIDIVGRLAKLMRKMNSEIVLLVGGAHVTAVPEETLNKYPFIDIGIIGEGEITLSELLKALDAGEKPDKIAGLIWRRGGKLLKTKPRELIKDLDGLPQPAWDLLPGFPEKYTPSANSFRQLPAAHLVTSRGCTGQCLFCDRSVFGRLPRALSASRVLEMIDHLVDQYRVREVQFFDDNFLLFPKRLEEICRGLRQRHPGLSWSCQARADMLSPLKLKMMKKAGCWQIGLGIESGSDQILRILKKGETVAQLKGAVIEIDRAGIEAKGFFILGNPGETRKTLKETLDFILSAPLAYAHTTFFTPFPGSQAYQIADKFGKLLYKDNWAKLGQGTIEPVYIPRGMTRVFLREQAALIFKSFYFRPKVFYRHFARAISKPRLWPAYVKGGLSVFSFSQ